MLLDAVLTSNMEDVSTLERRKAHSGIVVVKRIWFFPELYPSHSQKMNNVRFSSLRILRVEWRKVM